MQNLLLQPVDFQVEKTAWGTWRRHLSAQGSYYAEFASHAELLGWPLLHYTRGINPQTGRRTTARGVIAVGRVAVGGIALGQAAFGLCAIGQAGLGLLFGLGQAASGWYALGQLALGVEFGIGQLATGYTAVGQLALGEYVLAQLGIGSHLWTPEQSDPAAVAHFTALWEKFRVLF
ncbi:MAG: hypothetical protein AB1450_11165 [Pseudomonadota bacterium]